MLTGQAEDVKPQPKIPGDTDHPDNLLDNAPSATFETAIQSESQQRPDNDDEASPPPPPPARSSQKAPSSVHNLITNAIDPTSKNQLEGLVQKQLEALSPSKDDDSGSELGQLLENSDEKNSITTSKKAQTSPMSDNANLLDGLKIGIQSDSCACLDLDELLNKDEVHNSEKSREVRSAIHNSSITAQLGSIDLLEAADPGSLEVSPGDNSPLMTGDSLTDQRPSMDEAKVTGCRLMNVEKTRIYIHFEGVTTTVSWPSDTEAAEIQKAVLCACDCIYSSGSAQLLELIPVQDEHYLERLLAAGEDKLGGCLINLRAASPEQQHDQPTVWYQRGRLLPFENFQHDLHNNQLYLLEPTIERPELITITGDEYRRLLVSIPALSHIEATRAIKVLRKGTNLIKTTRINERHFRFFQLSTDLRRLLWYSGRKVAGDTTLNMSDICEIKITKFSGDDTKSLESRANDQFHRNCSFTIISKKGSLNLCAKNEDEFDIWVTGLKALAAHFHDVTINKVQLLGHSRRFRAEIEPAARQANAENNADQLSLPRTSTQQIPIKDLGEAELRIKKFAEMLHKQKSALEQLASRRRSESDSSQGQTFELREDAANMSDTELEYWQALQFTKDSLSALGECEKDLARYNEMVNRNSSLQERRELAESLEQRLWEINVNIENIADMLWRLSTGTSQWSFQQTFSMIQQQLGMGKEKIVQGWNQFTEQIVKPTVQRLKTQEIPEGPDMVEPPPP